MIITKKKCSKTEFWNKTLILIILIFFKAVIYFFIYFINESSDFDFKCI